VKKVERGQEKEKLTEDIKGVQPARSGLGFHQFLGRVGSKKEKEGKKYQGRGEGSLSTRVAKQRGGYQVGEPR